MAQSKFDLDMKDAVRDVNNRTNRILEMWASQAAASDKWYVALEEIANYDHKGLSWEIALERIQAIAKAAL